MKKLFLSAILITFLFSCKEKENAITIRVPESLASLPLLQLNGTIINHKKIRIEYFTDHMSAAAETLQGGSQLIFTGFELGVNMHRQNPEFIHITTPVWGLSSVVTGQNKIEKLSDLSGKKIMLPFAGSPLDVQMRHIIKKKDIRNVQFDYTGFNQAAQLLISGKVSAVCVPEPLATMLVKKNNMKRLALIAELWRETSGSTDAPQVSLFSTTKFTNQNKEFMQILINKINSEVISLNQGNINLHPYENEFGLERNIIEDALKNILFKNLSYKASKLEINSYTSVLGKKELPDSFFYVYE